MRLGDLAAEYQPDARSVRLRSEKRNKEVAAVAYSGAVVIYPYMQR